MGGCGEKRNERESPGAVWASLVDRNTEHSTWREREIDFSACLDGLAQLALILHPLPVLQV